MSGKYSLIGNNGRRAPRVRTCRRRDACGTSASGSARHDATDKPRIGQLAFKSRGRTGACDIAAGRASGVLSRRCRGARELMGPLRKQRVTRGQNFETSTSLLVMNSSKAADPLVCGKPRLMAGTIQKEFRYAPVST